MTARLFLHINQYKFKPNKSVNCQTSETLPTPEIAHPMMIRTTQILQNYQSKKGNRRNSPKKRLIIATEARIDVSTTKKRENLKEKARLRWGRGWCEKRKIKRINGGAGARRSRPSGTPNPTFTVITQLSSVPWNPGINTRRRYKSAAN